MLRRNSFTYAHEIKKKIAREEQPQSQKELSYPGRFCIYGEKHAKERRGQVERIQKGGGFDAAPCCWSSSHTGPMGGERDPE